MRVQNEGDAGDNRRKHKGRIRDNLRQYDHGDMPCVAHVKYGESDDELDDDSQRKAGEERCRDRPRGSCHARASAWGVAACASGSF